MCYNIWDYILFVSGREPRMSQKIFSECILSEFSVVPISNSHSLMAIDDVE
ncbi:unnamed protein product [Camellia sinensis]